jgi:hypothetical protein
VLAHTAAHISAGFHALRPDALRECALGLFAGLLMRDDLSLHSELQVSAPAVGGHAVVLACTCNTHTP